MTSYDSIEHYIDESLLIHGDEQKPDCTIYTPTMLEQKRIRAFSVSSSSDTSTRSDMLDLSYNNICNVVAHADECIVYEVFDSDVAIARRKRTFWQNVQMWILCNFEYYKRVYLGVDWRCCCGCLYWGLRRYRS